MNREQKRLSHKIGKRMMKLQKNSFELIPYSDIQKVNIKNKPDMAWKNNHHVVQLYKKERNILGILMDKWMIRRNDSQAIKDWYEIQEIKNDIIGREKQAIQIFPKESELVDVANMYWLFTESEIL